MILQLVHTTADYNSGFQQRVDTEKTLRGKTLFVIQPDLTGFGENQVPAIHFLSCLLIPPLPDSFPVYELLCFSLKYT